MVGQDALKVAATVKMIQNVLIGVMAFAVAVFWVTRIENRPGDQPRLEEIWYRFPKFILGFLAASLAFSLLFVTIDHGDQIVNGVLSGSKTLRGWFFCLAFVSIGLETNFRELARVVHGGKPLILYLAGQTLNLCLTLLMAWLMFKKVFPDAAAEMLRR
jgi:uncharacterized membrane protein YadS